MSYRLTFEQRKRANELEEQLADGKLTELELAYEVIYLRDEVDSLRAFKAGVEDSTYPFFYRP